MNDMAHLKHIVKRLPNDELDNNGLALLGECDDSARTVFSRQYIDMLKKYKDFIHIIHVTD